MANKTNTKAPAEEIEVVEDMDVQSVKPEKETAKKAVAKKIDPDQYVTVRNGFQGRLVYKSSRTGERFVWEEFGDEQDMELSELKNAKNSKKTYFTNNWFMFDEAWIVDYLGMKQYYKSAVSIDDFDKLFEKSPAELESLIADMSEGQKKSVAYRARALIALGEIDSNKVITTLEKCLGVELIER